VSGFRAGTGHANAVSVLTLVRYRQKIAALPGAQAVGYFLG